MFHLIAPAAKLSEEELGIVRVVLRYQDVKTFRRHEVTNTSGGGSSSSSQ